MIKSMTGYGRGEKITDTGKCTVEIKSVNHRYLDLSIKLPRKPNMFEGEIRNVLKDYIQRGKVDVFINYEDYSKESVNIKYNPQIAAEYMKHLRTMAEEFDIDVLGKLPIDPKLAAACDHGLIEFFEGDWLEDAVKKVETL